jgi:4-aminobutyrate aminotransferase-like enzyme
MSVIGQLSKEKITELFARHVSSGKVEFFQNAGIDLVPGKREGVYLYDIDGQRLINCNSNGGVFNLGHRNPQVLAALEEAMAELDIGTHHAVSEHRAILAERLAAISPGDINRVIYGVSGGEVVDAAIKLARGHTGRPGIVSAEGAYHGHTGYALPAGHEQYSKPFEPLVPGYTHSTPPSARTPRPSCSRPSPRRSGSSSRPMNFTRESVGFATSAARCSSATRCRPGSGDAAHTGASTLTVSFRTSS